MTDSTVLPFCPACRQGRLHAIVRTEVFRPNGNKVEVELLASLCDACGVETTRASQHDENLRRLAARKEQYGSLLMGEEIVALRKRYGVTQQAASRIFGKGKIAFSRYENEVTYPDESATLLLQLAIEQPSAMKSLADKAGVELPLWAERCEDERRVKVRTLSAVFAAAEAAPRQHDRFVAPVHAHTLRGVGPSVWATRLTAIRPTTAPPNASNDGRLPREPVAA